MSNPTRSLSLRTLTIRVPKPLIPVNDIPLMTRWLHILREANVSVEEDTYVVCNHANYDQMVNWANQTKFPLSHIFNDGSTSNDTRLGAVADLHFMLQKAGFEQPHTNGHAAANGHSHTHSSASSDSSHPWSGLLIIGGDTLFYPSFSLPSLLSSFRSTPSHSILLRYRVTDPSKYGIIELENEENNIVTSFLEKPKPDATKSRLACPCLYVLSVKALEEIKGYVESAQQRGDRDCIDAPGSLIKELIERGRRRRKEIEATANGAASGVIDPSALPFVAMPIRGRFDIGGLETYIECDQYFRGNENLSKSS